MAVLEFWPRGDAPDTTTGIRIGLHEFDEAMEWLADETRAGSFTFTRHGNIAVPDGRAYFWFTDGALAFEFSLRWRC